MAYLKISNCSLSGIAATVPAHEVFNLDYPFLTDQEKQFLVKKTGINARRVAEKKTTAGDLCFAAAEKLLQSLNWNPKDIAILIFVSQTPDYITPATAPILQHRLGLPEHCIAFDINLGCSGYVYGLSVVAGMINKMKGAKGLLLVGDKSSQLVSPKDKSTALLFSDAGSATALEYDIGAADMHFDLYTDGRGYETIMVKDGGGRNPISNDSLHPKEIANGIIRSDHQLILKGIDIFNFTLKKVVPSIDNLYRQSSIPKEYIDYFVFHQANKLINDAMTRKLGITDIAMAPQSLHLYGNSSSASIPVTLTSMLQKTLSQRTSNVFLSGFGVGLSWANAILEVANIVCPPMIVYDKN